MSTRKPDTNPTNTERLKMAQLLLRGIRGVEPGESSGFTEILAPYFGKRVKPKAGVTPPSPRRVVIAPDEDPIPPARVEYVPQQGREWINRTQGQHLYTQATTEEEIPSRRAGRISLPNPTRSLRLPNFQGLWFLYALDLFDCDRDGHTDLIVSLNGGSSFVYLLDTGKQQFRIPNAEEQARLILPAISH
jgi:hypothetical protein